MVLFIVLCKMFLSFETADEILKCDHLNETSDRIILSCVTVQGYAVQVCSNSLSLWLKSHSVTIGKEAVEQYFPVVLFIVLTFKSGINPTV